MSYDLFHYYEKELGPFKNLSSLPLKEGEQIMRQIKRHGKGFASQRTDDYLQIRRELEEKARAIFISKGGHPMNNFPHYMTFGPCEWIREWYTEGQEVRIRLEEFNEKSISFTYGDLFPTMRYKDGKEYRGQVYTIDELLILVDKYGLPQDWNKEGKHGPERYIEVQVWDDEVLKAYI